MRRFLAAAGLAVLGLSCWAQPLWPQEIDVGDLIKGYVEIDSIVVVHGHVAFVYGETLMTPNLPSAMWPMIVDTKELPNTQLQNLKVRCAADRTTSGGCTVRVRGQVQKVDGRLRLKATAIEFLPP